MGRAATRPSPHHLALCVWGAPPRQLLGLFGSTALRLVSVLGPVLPHLRGPGCFL